MVCCCFAARRYGQRLKCCYVEGMNVRILEPDDGSGWVKVADEDGNSGLVPASYIQMAQGGSADTEKRLGSGERGMSKSHDSLPPPCSHYF